MSKRAGERQKGKKQEFVIVAPPYFGGRELGITLADDVSKVVGRTVKVSLYNLTDDFTKQYILIKFKVIRVKDSVADTIFYGHEYGREFLRSLVRRGTSRIDGIYNLATADGVKIRVQATVFTQKRVRRGKQRSIRHIMREILEEASSTLRLEQFSQELVLGKTGSDIYNAVKKILIPRHVGVVKSKVLSIPQELIEVAKPAADTSTV